MHENTSVKDKNKYVLGMLIINQLPSNYNLKLPRLEALYVK